MTASFEEEGRLTTETVTRPRSNPSVGVATVFIVLTGGPVSDVVGIGLA